MEEDLWLYPFLLWIESFSFNISVHVFILSATELCVCVRVCICACVCVCQAQQHRTFNSAVAKQPSMGHYTKPLYALNGRGHTQTLNGLMLDDMVEEEDGEEEVCVCVSILTTKYTWPHNNKCSRLHVNQDLFLRDVVLDTVNQHFIISTFPSYLRV